MKKVIVIIINILVVIQMLVTTNVMAASNTGDVASEILGIWKYTSATLNGEQVPISEALESGIDYGSATVTFNPDKTFSIYEETLAVLGMQIQGNYEISGNEISMKYQSYNVKLKYISSNTLQQTRGDYIITLTKIESIHNENDIVSNESQNKEENVEVLPKEKVKVEQTQSQNDTKNDTKINSENENKDDNQKVNSTKTDMTASTKKLPNTGKENVYFVIIVAAALMGMIFIIKERKIQLK